MSKSFVSKMLQEAEKGKVAEFGTEENGGWWNWKKPDPKSKLSYFNEVYKNYFTATVAPPHSEDASSIDDSIPGSRPYGPEIE